MNCRNPDEKSMPGNGGNFAMPSDRTFAIAMKFDRGYLPWMRDSRHKKSPVERG
jgi:hypothetical protein